MIRSADCVETQASTGRCSGDGIVFFSSLTSGLSLPMQQFSLNWSPQTNGSPGGRAAQNAERRDTGERDSPAQLTRMVPTYLLACLNLRATRHHNRTSQVRCPTTSYHMHYADNIPRALPSVASDKMKV